MTDDRAEERSTRDAHHAHMLSETAMIRTCTYVPLLECTLRTVVRIYYLVKTTGRRLFKVLTDTDVQISVPVISDINNTRRAH